MKSFEYAVCVGEYLAISEMLKDKTIPPSRALEMLLEKGEYWQKKFDEHMVQFGTKGTIISEVNVKKEISKINEDAQRIREIADDFHSS